MNRFNLKLNHLMRIADKATYSPILAAVARDKVLPDVIPQMLDLEEYVNDFLTDINGHMTVDIVFDDTLGNRVGIMIWRREELCGTSFELSFDELDEYDIPHLGDAIYHMWNAYIDVFMGMHSTYVPPIPEGDSDATD